MPDSKITALASTGTGTDPANDPLVIVDVSDTSMAASGTTKKVTLNNLLSSSPTATGAFSVTGLVTAGSATITGDLTVDTSTLKVDSTNDRVGVGTASPAAGAKLGVTGATVVSTSDYVGSSTWAARFTGSSNGASSGISLLTNSAAGQPTPASIHATPIADFRSALTATYSADNTGAGYFAVNRFNPSGSNTLEHYKIDNSGVATWSNVGGGAGTAMTLNSTGLGVGAATPDFKFVVNGTQAVPSTSGSSATDGSLRIGAPGTGLVIDTGVTAASAVYGWIQARARTDYSSNFNLVLQPNGGNVGIGVTPAGTGGCLQLKSGITFPATQVASSDANTLDDYEEGVFTPIISGSTSAGTGTYSIQSGRYTKIGRLVQFQIRVTWSAHTGTGNLNIDQLPFVSSAVANSFASVSIGYFSDVALTASRVATAFIETNVSYIPLAQYPVGGGSASYVPMDTSGDIMISGTYTV